VESIVQQMGAGAPYVAQLVPEVRERLEALPPPATSLESEHARFYLFDAITGFLTKAAETKPLLLTLDDLHWADKASLLLLQFVARELHRAPILVLGTYREAEARQAAEVMDALAVVGRDAHHAPLRGLNEAEIGQVIEAIAGQPASAALTRTVRQATEGNPFFVDELARLLAAEGRIGGPETLTAGAYRVPQGVREAIRRRLKPCSEECRRVLSVACVVGRDFDLPILQQVCDLPVERLLLLLGEVLAAGMVVEISAPLGRFSFSHALVRETLYDDLGTAERARLHRRVGEILEGLYGANPEPHLAELAHHFLRAGPAGDPTRAIDYSIRAARRASSLLAHDEAAVNYERALELLELDAASEGRRAEVLLSLGEALNCAGDAAGARRSFQRAAELSRCLGDPDRLARAALGFGAGGFGGVWSVSRAHDEALVSLLEEAARALGASDSIQRARLLARLATALHYAPARERRESALRERGGADARGSRGTRPSGSAHDGGLRRDRGKPVLRRGGVPASRRSGSALRPARSVSL
jgi:predicted ATPase